MTPTPTVVVLVTAVSVLNFILLTRGSTDWNCTIKFGISNFRLHMLCGKRIYAQYMSGIDRNYSCVVGHFKCHDDDTVTCDSIVSERGVQFTQASRLTDLGNGVILREENSEGGGESVQVLDIVTSFSLFANGNVKASFYICGNSKDGHHQVKRAVVTSFKNTDMMDEIKLMNKFFTCGGLYNVPCLCDVEQLLE